MIWKRFKIESKRPDPDLRFCHAHATEIYRECVRVRVGKKLENEEQTETEGESESTLSQVCDWFCVCAWLRKFAQSL